MCKVYHTIGSLTAVKKHLLQNNVTGFNSVNELLSFQKNYAITREQLVSNQKTLLTEERNNLNEGILQLEHQIEYDKQALQQKFDSQIETLRQQFDELAEAPKTIIQEFTYSFKALFKLIQINYLKVFSKVLVSRTVAPKIKILDEKRKRHSYLVFSFEEAVRESSRLALDDLDHRKRVIDEINSFIYGAIGEQKVVAELELLPDDYILINDFSFTFTKPLYHKQQRTQIKTVQIDHLLVSPAGVFLIETKNWSKESVQSLSLRSPVAQIQRTSFALYVLLKQSSGFKIGKHHWGERKITIRNLIVLIKHKPKEEFQYVKILTLNELVGYIEYFQPTMSYQETQEIADYLIDLNT